MTWIPLLLEQDIVFDVPLVALLAHRPCCGMTFGMSVFSKEYVFPVSLLILHMSKIFQIVAFKGDDVA
jgi:hypothetical protein